MEQIPAPILSTPIEEEEKILESKTFELESDKKNKIEIKISKSISKITLEGKDKNSIEPVIYCSNQSIEEIKINKYFLMFDNLDEIYEEIINLINNNKHCLFEENNKLIISIPLSTTKIKEIKIILYKKEKTDKEKINDLYSIIYNLKNNYNNKINELIGIVEQQNKKINELINVNQQQNTKINELNDKIDKLIKNEGNNSINENYNKNILDDSLIINKNINYISNLYQWISEREGKFKTKLLFRKSINGNSFNEFHRLCDNQGKTLVIIQAESGLILGGFTEKDWNTSEMWYKDDKSFLFSLTNGRIFPMKKDGRYSIRGSKALGPWFAFLGFRDCGKYDLTEGNYFYKNDFDSCYENFSELIPNDKKEVFFDVKEVEIYKIYN